MTRNTDLESSETTQRERPTKANGTAESAMGRESRGTGMDPSSGAFGWMICPTNRTEESGLVHSPTGPGESQRVKARVPKRSL